MVEETHIVFRLSGQAHGENRGCFGNQGIEVAGGFHRARNDDQVALLHSLIEIVLHDSPVEQDDDGTFYDLRLQSFESAAGRPAAR